MKTDGGKKRKRRIWWVVSASLTVLLVIGFVFDPLGTNGLKSELARAGAAGFPVEPGDIFLGQLPRNEDNAALVFDRMMDLAGSSWDRHGKRSSDIGALNAGYNDFDVELANKYLDDNSELLRLAEFAAQLPEYHANKDLSDPTAVLMPESSLAKDLSKAFAARAMLSLDGGDVDSALDDLRRILQIANHMEKTGFLIGNLNAIANRSTYADAVEHMIAFSGADVVFLEGLISQLSDWPERGDWTQALRTEAYSQVWIPQHLYDLEIHCMRISWGWRDGLPADESDWETASWGMPSTRAKATRLALEHWKRILNSYDPNDDDPIGWGRRIDSRLPTGIGFWRGAEVLNRVFSIELEGVGKAEIRTRARREVLKSTLEALIAMRNGSDDPFANLGIDPFTGVSLLLKKTKDGFKIYSAGEDRVDDGGLEFRDATSHNRDIVFEYPKKRGPAPAGFYGP